MIEKQQDFISKNIVFMLKTSSSKLLFYILITLYSCNLFAGNIVIEGNYQGKNLIIQNPYGSAGVGFCVTKVMVNGQLTTDEINSSAFEVDLSILQLKIGDKVAIRIEHKDDCRPKILNPDILKARSTYEVVTMKADKEGTLKWTTKNEQGQLPFVIEQFRWNKWVKVGEVDGKGTAGPNEYSFKLTPHHGENQVRLKQVDYSSLPRYSKPVKFTSGAPAVNVAVLKVKNEVKFEGGETMYEIFDKFGNLVKKGYGPNVDVANLSADVYYLNYDNKTTEFIKRK